MADAANRHVQVTTWLVSGNYFDVLGVPTAAGRSFLPEEDRTPGGAPVALISYDFWRRQLGGDPGAVGREIALNGHPFTIVGVAAQGFRGVSPTDAAPDLWVPLTMQPAIMPEGADMLHRVEGGRAPVGSASLPLTLLCNVKDRRARL